MKTHKQIVWVTGATSGIGKAVAEAFLESGATVALSSRDADRTLSLAKQLSTQYSNCLPIPCDVRDANQIIDAAEKVEKTLGRIDVLINNAGTTVFKSFLDTSPEEFDEILNTNLRGTFLCTQAVLPGMISRKSGTIVMINSVTSKYEFTNSSIYTASKLGLRGMTDVLRKEVRDHGIRLITIMPGATETNIWAPSVVKKHSHRMMKPSDVADIIIDICRKPSNIVVEEILVRPITGDV